MKRLAVLSHILPPSTSGQAVILSRLFQYWGPDQYCLISRTAYAKPQDEDSTGALDGYLCAEYFHVTACPPISPPRWRLGSLTVTLINLVRSCLHRTNQVTFIMKQNGCDAILACSGDILDIPAAFLASRKLHAAFYIHLFDDYTFQWTNRFLRWIAGWIEKLVVRKAKAIIVPNEFLARAYQNRHGINPIVIYNPANIPAAISQISFENSDRRLQIVYTGSIYHAHYDAFMSLLESLENLKEKLWEMHVYTSQSQEELDQKGLHPPIIIHSAVPQDQIGAIQQQADILFLPLAFRSEIPEIIQTSMPGKMGEYLASARPILVHAPKESFLAWYFKEHRCGLVVDQPDVALLAAAIQSLANNTVLRQQLSVNAYERAKIDFSADLIQMKYKQIFMENKA